MMAKDQQKTTAHKWKETVGGYVCIQCGKTMEDFPAIECIPVNVDTPNWEILEDTIASVVKQEKPFYPIHVIQRELNRLNDWLNIPYFVRNPPK